MMMIREMLKNCRRESIVSYILCYFERRVYLTGESKGKGMLVWCCDMLP